MEVACTSLMPLLAEIGRYVVLVLDNAAVNSLSPLAMVGVGAIGITQELPGARLGQSWSFSHPLTPLLL